MHELSLLESVRDIIEAQAREQPFSQVKQVTLSIGKLSCVSAEALRFGFDVVMQGSLAEQAELVINELDGIGLCAACGQQVALNSIYEPCPLCGHPGVDLLQGMEMRVQELLVV